MLKVGLIGLPNAGKSTLFNALTEAGALTAPYQFSTVDPNKSNFKLLDKSAKELSKSIGYGDVSLPIVELWDIAGLVKGAHNGEGLGSEFLGYIKDCNLLIHVVRQNSSDNSQMPIDAHIVENEIAFFDHTLLKKPYEKSRRMVKLYPRNTEYKQNDRVLTKAFKGTKDGTKVSDILSEDEIALLDDIGLISSKPLVYLINIDSKIKEELNAEPGKGAIKSNVLDVASLLDFTNNDLRLLGIDNTPIDDLRTQVSEAIIFESNLKRFYTVGHLGVGLWLADMKSSARSCAELVHQEIGDNLRSVEVSSFEDFLIHKNWKDLRTKGLVKTYSHSYLPKDQDVLLFNMNK